MSLSIGDVPEKTDYLVIGTGFGGSVMAARLAQAGRQVCVLERGKPYPPGSFPRTPDGLAANFWDPGRDLHGMFDVRSFIGIDAIVASGLGGGSLIYANVMLRMEPDAFTQPHPDNQTLWENWSFDYEDLEPHYRAVERFLDIQTVPVDHADFDLTKTRRFLDGSDGQAELASLAVQFRGPDGRPVVGGEMPKAHYGNIFGTSRRTCKLCGECDIGCNEGAKNSLDHTYLSAASHWGASIHTMTEARIIVHRRCDPDGYLFEVAYTVHPCDPADETGWRWVKAKQVILAAGSLGSTELLLRSTAGNHVRLPYGVLLGSRFCGNGDLLGFAVPRTASQNFEGTRGPVITAYRHLRYRTERDSTGLRADVDMYLEDGGFPPLIAWLATIGDPRLLLGNLARGAAPYLWGRFRNAHETNVSALVGGLLKGSAAARALPLLGMGRDTADGELFLRRGGPLDSTWRLKSSRAYFEQVHTQMRAMAARLGARYVTNPLWGLNRVITVHPLGGCPADTSHSRGVVDRFGRVHGVPGLRVCDGSVFPGPIGANPSLTIAAFADWSATQLLDETDV
ncbi:GMC oxidoreductase [Mycobacterium sp. SMC-4]|uniref:GMC oxidoreductase n=1 Tax=Mycobacterium sp. SMC-4 TaxID=2857059 RepID=UPI0021B17DE0|nr:GMC family oxidoreductase [Mycobacterium sp. SMC-4]UXA18253.1 GMC family oxidoreductase [Mycobacterium sp. SMC-4]